MAILDEGMFKLDPDDYNLNHPPKVDTGIEIFKAPITKKATTNILGY